MNTDVPLQINAECRFSYISPYTEPLSFRAGERLFLGRRDPDWPGWVRVTNSAGKEAWVPETYLEIQDDIGWALRDYTSQELNVDRGEPIEIHFEELGWVWATNQAGESGWIPNTHIEFNTR